RVAHRPQVDVVEAGPEAGRGLPIRIAERREPVREIDAASVETRRGARDLETLGQPDERALEVGEPETVDPRLRAREIPFEPATAPVEMEHAGEMPFASQLPVA